MSDTTTYTCAYAHAGRSESLPVDEFFEFLAGLEERHAFGRHVHGAAGLGISALARAAAAEAETAEAADLDFVAPRQGVLDAVENGVDDNLGLTFGESFDLL